VSPIGQVLVTGEYQDTAVFDAITLHSAGEQDIFLSELKAIPDNDNSLGGLRSYSVALLYEDPKPTHSLYRYAIDSLPLVFYASSSSRIFEIAIR
jgi:hypothetical protein